MPFQPAEERAYAVDGPFQHKAAVRFCGVQDVGEQRRDDSQIFATVNLNRSRCTEVHGHISTFLVPVTDERRLLIAYDAQQRNTTIAYFAETAAGRLKSWEGAIAYSEDVQKFFIPHAGFQIEQERPPGDGFIHERGACQTVCQVSAERSEKSCACIYLSFYFRIVLNSESELGTSEIST